MDCGTRVLTDHIPDFGIYLRVRMNIYPNKVYMLILSICTKIQYMLMSTLMHIYQNSVICS